MIDALIRAALAEDHAPEGDITSHYFITAHSQSSAAIVSRQNGKLSGAEIAQKVFLSINPQLEIKPLLHDGANLQPGSTIMRVFGDTRSLLAAERTALNFLQHLSGVATITAKFVEKIANTKAKIVDTRKTLPGWRQLQKNAVLHGGGHNHRMGLHDRILVKDNHLCAVGNDPEKLSSIIKKIRSKHPKLIIEFEADCLKDALLFCELGVDIVLLDNMSPDQLREAVTHIAGRCKTEASGGVTLENVTAIASAGVDYISVGALTHSAPALDIALDFE